MGDFIKVAFSEGIVVLETKDKFGLTKSITVEDAREGKQRFYGFNRNFLKNEKVHKLFEGGKNERSGEDV